MTRSKASYRFKTLLLFVFENDHLNPQVVGDGSNSQIDKRGDFGPSKTLKGTSPLSLDICFEKC